MSHSLQIRVLTFAGRLTAEPPGVKALSTDCSHSEDSIYAGQTCESVRCTHCQTSVCVSQTFSSRGINKTVVRKLTRSHVKNKNFCRSTDMNGLFLRLLWLRRAVLVPGQLAAFSFLLLAVKRTLNTLETRRKSQDPIWEFPPKQLLRSLSVITTLMLSCAWDSCDLTWTFESGAKC